MIFKYRIQARFKTKIKHCTIYMYKKNVFSKDYPLLKGL